MAKKPEKSKKALDDKPIVTKAPLLAVPPEPILKRPSLSGK
jgi:hypothetical protein